MKIDFHKHNQSIEERTRNQYAIYMCDLFVNGDLLTDYFVEYSEFVSIINNSSKTKIKSRLEETNRFLDAFSNVPNY